jgi:UDP-N-acetylmuramate dehydrogenase
MKLRTDVDLRTLNTFGVTALASQLVDLEHAEQLPDIRQWLGGRTAFILGGGSNLLFTRDLTEPVIRVCLLGRTYQIDSSSDAVRVVIGAGESWHGLVTWSLEMGFQGLENLALIPGTVGAAPIQNIGAYGAELADVFESVRVFDLAHGTWLTLGLQDCQFSYRDSIFKQARAAQWLICSVTLRLRHDAHGNGRLKLDYGDLRAQVDAIRETKGLGSSTQAIRPQEVAEAVIAIRTRRLPDPARLGNAGSFFANPIIGRDEALALQARFPGLPAYPVASSDPSGQHGPTMKLPAAWLIERAGWKGVRQGDAGVHTNHALVLVNHGGASGQQIRRLAEEIQRDIHTLFGLTLTIEPRVV